MDKWNRIKYDYVPKYCKTCMIQGHDEEQCYVKQPELFKDKKKKDESKDEPAKETNNEVKNQEDNADIAKDGFVEQRKKQPSEKPSNQIHKGMQLG